MNSRDSNVVVLSDFRLSKEEKFENLIASIMQLTNRTRSSLLNGYSPKQDNAYVDFLMMLAENMSYEEIARKLEKDYL